MAWLSIKTSPPPRDGTLIDLWVPKECGEPFGRIPDCHWSEKDHGWVSKHFPRLRFVPTEPTHWMPSPEPPR